MRTRLIALALWGLVWPLVARADEPAKDAKQAVKEIDLKGLKRAPAEGGDVKKPTVITSAEELAKAFPEEELQGRIKKEVDFDKQRLLFFAWAGSGGDKLDFKVEDGKKGPEAVFTYRTGLTRDLRGHFHLYVLPKDATWRMADK
jgi:hypothetical protein